MVYYVGGQDSKSDTTSNGKNRYSSIDESGSDLGRALLELMSEDS